MGRYAIAELVAKMKSAVDGTDKAVAIAHWRRVAAKFPPGHISHRYALRALDALGSPWRVPGEDDVPF